MLKRFWNDRSGNYALATIACIVPLFGALALGVDYTEMSRQKQSTLNALDAAAVATARRLIEGGLTEAQLNTYARNFFNTNLGTVNSALTTLTLTLPPNNMSGGSLKLRADLKYQPYFLRTFEKLGGFGRRETDFTATTEVQLKNTMEIALVLDNSGSMSAVGTGSGKTRMELLKTASKELVDTLSGQAKMMQQLNRPVQIGLVPFSATVNVGWDKTNASWIDTQGRSWVSHENFYYPTMPPYGPSKSYDFSITHVNGLWQTTGKDWGVQRNLPMNRFWLYSAINYIHNGVQKHGVTWSGCVEARLWPHHVTDELPTNSNPDTLFVPTFAPDEAGDRWSTSYTAHASNNWWDDFTGVAATDTVLVRQMNPHKYFGNAPNNYFIPTFSNGPNSQCTTWPITPLTDVSTATGLNSVKADIDRMYASGLTNVTEGMAWGWRVLSSREPFTGGRNETEKGNDKVLIVLTDGINTYFTPQTSVPGSQDQAGNRSSYGAYGYVENAYRPNNGRIFEGTTISKSTYTDLNYSAAMNQHYAQLCTNAKNAKLMVITIALDLNAGDPYEKLMIDLLRNCSSESRVRKGEKLFWNATGKSLVEDFKAIGDELSNLRITS